MKTSWNETRQMERYLLKKMSLEESLLYQARLLTNPLLRMQAFYQKKVYTLLHFYHRKKLKEEVNQVHDKLFADVSKTDFQQSILYLFNS